MKWQQESVGTPRRVVIVGSSGSGKTTLGRKLEEKWRIPFCDQDEFAWLPGWVSRPIEEQRRDIEKVAARESWIIAGNYSKHRDITWEQADLIIWLDLPFWTCLWRGLKRALVNLIQRRTLCNGNYESWNRLLSWDDRSIVHWIWYSHPRKKERYQRLFIDEKDARLPPCAQLKSQQKIDLFLENSL